MKVEKEKEEQSDGGKEGGKLEEWKKVEGEVGKCKEDRSKTGWM